MEVFTGNHEREKKWTLGNCKDCYELICISKRYKHGRIRKGKRKIADGLKKVERRHCVERLMIRLMLRKFENTVDSFSRNKKDAA